MQQRTTMAGKHIKITQHRIVQAAMRQDLGAFAVKAFQTICAGGCYMHNWHLDALAYNLLQVALGKEQRLCITQPPRSLKSVFTSVIFAAWYLGHNPGKMILCVSYSHVLATDFSRLFRGIVTSKWYRELFPAVELVKDNDTECITSNGGGRLTVAVEGSLTGRGADLIIVDDPIKAEDAQSEKVRRSVNEWFGTTLLSRLNDKRSGAIIVVMQRLHEDDLAGKLLRTGEWAHLNLPAIADEDQEVPIGPGVTYLRKQDEVLHPARESLAIYERLKREMGSIAFSAQYQQRPVPLEGNLVKREWLNYYQTIPHRNPGARVVQSWDVASTTSDEGNWSVCTTWLIIKRHYYLLDVWRGRLQFPELRRKVIALALEHKAEVILIERAGPGLHLIQEMRANQLPDVPLPIGIQPIGDKIVRMEAQSSRFECGQVWLPDQALWLATLLNELLAFPNARHDDQVDSVSQFLNWAERDRWTSFDPSSYQRPIVYCSPNGGVAIG
jgi:predicted phage terminase large subunit-like protein